VAGLHVDLVRAPEQLDAVVAALPEDRVLSLGIIDGRNVWRADLPSLLDRLEKVVAQRGADRVVLAPSCSLLHVPVHLHPEDALAADVKRWLAFAVQKVEELATLGRALNEGRDAVRDSLAASAHAAASRKTSPKIHSADVALRMAAVTAAMARRHSAFDKRR